MWRPQRKVAAKAASAKHCGGHSSIRVSKARVKDRREKSLRVLNAGEGLLLIRGLEAQSSKSGELGRMGCTSLAEVL